MVHCPETIKKLHKEKDKPKELTIEERVKISCRVGEYLDATKAFNEATNRYTDACKKLGEVLGANTRFVVQINFKHYLVTTDNQGNFDVEEIQSV